MAVTITHGSYKFTISTPSSMTVNEGNINSAYTSVYKPTVKRDKTGTAITRYIFFQLESSNVGWEIAVYKAVFTKTGTSATVTSYRTLRMGDIARAKLEDGVNTLYVGVANSLSGDEDAKSVAMTVNVNLYPTITLTSSKSQGSPAPAAFGYIKGFCTGSVTATIKKTWTYTGGSVTVPISSSSLTGNGKSASGTSGTSLTLSLGTLNATSITVSATAKNSRGLTASASITVTCQDYKAPQVTQLTAVRDSGNEQNANITVKYSLHSTNQLGTTGDIKANYTIKSGGTTVASGSGTICVISTCMVLKAARNTIRRAPAATTTRSGASKTGSASTCPSAIPLPARTSSSLSTAGTVGATRSTKPSGRRASRTETSRCIFSCSTSSLPRMKR